MLPHNKTMVLNVEYNITPVSAPTASGSEVVLVGVIDYTVVVADDVNIARGLCLYLPVLFSFFLKITEYFLAHPGVRSLSQYIESVLGFFVVEAKDRDVKLDDHV
jgi:hypothetical protein